jgi:hypothetical protein
MLAGEKTKDVLPPFYTTVRCSQCGFSKEIIDRGGCPEKCGRVSSVGTLEVGLREIIARAYLRLQAADVPRGPWHEEVSDFILKGSP